MSKLNKTLSFPAISVSVINCKSLNVSTITSYHQKLKIHGIVKIKSDVIILSDIRLGRNADGGIAEEIAKMFFSNPYCSYHFYYNSSTNSRGVGILIKSNLTISVLAEARDSSENILALRLQHLGTEFVLCGIYGPNSLCPNFFTDLANILNHVKNLPIIVGGDWNCTPSTADITLNPDVINMAKLPKIAHSRLLATLMDKFDLVDLYRVYHPNTGVFFLIALMQ